MELPLRSTGLGTALSGLSVYFSEHDFDFDIVKC